MWINVGYWMIMIMVGQERDMNHAKGWQKKLTILFTFES